MNFLKGAPYRHGSPVLFPCDYLAVFFGCFALCTFTLVYALTSMRVCEV